MWFARDSITCKARVPSVVHHERAQAEIVLAKECRCSGVREIEERKREGETETE